MSGRTGGFLHTQVLLGRIAAFFTARGALVRREFPVAIGGRRGAVDLFILAGDHRIVCEAELTPRRMPNDVAKAKALRAGLLLIVVPTRAMARRGAALMHRLQHERSTGSPVIWILPPGLALQRLANKWDLMTGSLAPLTINPESAAMPVTGRPTRKGDPDAHPLA